MKILFKKRRDDGKKNSYERRVYESVDDEAIAHNLTGKKVSNSNGLS